ncbi:MAG: TonB-dependent receptor [Spongiibacteraceae bacterium]
MNRSMSFIGLASLLATSTVCADTSQISSATSGRKLDEVVVTARKTEENLQDVPVAVTAFSGEDLQQQNAVRIADVARLTPGLYFKEPTTSPSGLVISQRGQIQTDILATLDPSVGAYVDGLYWARAYGLNSDLIDMQSVQVLKGPQGTLFGRNTTGGAIVFQTYDPDTSQIRGKLSAMYGRFNEQVVSGMLNLPIIEDRVGLRVAVQHNQRDGYIEDILTGREYGDRDNLSARAKLLIEVSDEFRVMLSGESFDMDQNGPARQLSFMRQPVTASTTQPSFASTARTLTQLFPNSSFTADQLIAHLRSHPDDVAMNTPAHTEASTHTFTGTAELDTFYGSVKFIAGYRTVEAGAIPLDIDGSPWRIHDGLSQQDLDQWSGELQTTGAAFDDALDFAGGVYYFTESGGDRSLTSPLVGILSTSTSTFGDVDNDSKGIYGQATWHLTDAWSLTGGLRYSVDNKGVETRNYTEQGTFQNLTGVRSCSMAPAAQAPNCALGRSDQFDGVSYTFGIDYRLATDALIYAKVSRGFRAGGQNLRANSVQTFVPFEPERADEIEAGLKSEFFDSQLRFNAAAYRSLLTDAQRTSFAINPTTNQLFTILGNAGKVRVWGMEAELTAVLFDGFTLSATGAITKPEYESFSEAPTPQNPTGDRRSERFEGVPESTLSLAAMYQHDLSFGELMLRADYAWQDDTALVPFNNPRDPNNAAIIKATTQPASGVVNARAALTFGQYEAAIFGRNLADNRDAVSAIFVDAFGYSSSIRREPRTYGVQFTYSY